jgi:hypothetical protein
LLFFLTAFDILMLAGLGWLIFLSPPLANYLLTPLEVIGFVAEAVLMLWLLAMGVNSQRWNEQAGAKVVAATL